MGWLVRRPIVLDVGGAEAGRFWHWTSRRFIAQIMAVQIHGVDRVSGPRVESPDRAEKFPRSTSLSNVSRI